MVSSGQKVQVRVKAVDADSGKVSLSMIAKEDEQPERPKKQVSVCDSDARSERREERSKCLWDMAQRHEQLLCRLDSLCSSLVAFSSPKPF